MWFNKYFITGCTLLSTRQDSEIENLNFGTTVGRYLERRMSLGVLSRATVLIGTTEHTYVLALRLQCAVIYDLRPLPSLVIVCDVVEMNLLPGHLPHDTLHISRQILIKIRGGFLQARGLSTHNKV